MIMCLGLSGPSWAKLLAHEPVQVPHVEVEEDDDDEPAFRWQRPSLGSPNRQQSSNLYSLLPELLDEALTGPRLGSRRSGSGATNQAGNGNSLGVSPGRLGGGNAEDMGVLVNSLNELVGQLDRNPEALTAAGHPGSLSLSQLGTSMSRIKLLTGAAMVITALLMMIWHIVAWRGHSKDETLDEFDRRYFHVRFRRRMQTVAIFGALGILIPLGDRFAGWGYNSSVYTAYSGVVWVLSIWVLVLAAVHRFSTKRYLRSALTRLRRRQHELEKKLEYIVADSTTGSASAEG
jgi:hypothetical protein